MNLPDRPPPALRAASDARFDLLLYALLCALVASDAFRVILSVTDPSAPGMAFALVWHDAAG